MSNARRSRAAHGNPRTAGDERLIDQPSEQARDHGAIPCGGAFGPPGRRAGVVFQGKPRGGRPRREGGKETRVTFAPDVGLTGEVIADGRETAGEGKWRLNSA